ncbi:helix-turn-helix domain-containing protein [Amycolatopsis sp. NBC_00345]|uniref:helix-turn-helix domain-containing protein n=1 Tax=Amycolatopsis sp. NBC_00345 TaxID=2975955 RepID=UPI002E26BDA0
MTAGDARGIPADALEVLRRRAVVAVEAGSSRAEVARAFGLSRKTVGEWVRAYRTAGDRAFRPKPRGRRPGEQLALSPAQQAWAVKAIIAGTPETYGLPHLLWNRQAVAELVNHRFRVLLSTTTVTHYLTRWSFLDDDAAARDRPAPARRVFPGGADPGLPGREVVWLAWTRPRTPPGAGRGQFSAGHNLMSGFRDYFGDVNVMSAVSRRGVLYFQAGLGPFDADRAREFLRRLSSQTGRRLDVVVDTWPVQGQDILRSASDGIPVRFGPPRG